MNKKEKIILKALVNNPKGQLSPVDFINGIAGRDERSVQNLISKGYVATEPHPHPGLHGGFYDVPFYFATEKGLLEFESWYKRIWFYFKGDLRTIIIALITAVGTTLITLLIGKMLK